VVTPLWWYPRLLDATPHQHTNYELFPFGVHWPDVDEDLSMKACWSAAKRLGAKQREPA
jgi:hypothetical protein